MRARAGWIWAVLVAVSGASCLFSTTAPRRTNQDGGGTTDPNRAVVTGVVRLRDHTDGHTRVAPDRAVRGLWYRRNEEGQSVQLWYDIVRTNGNGVYELACSDRRLQWVEVQTMICDYDPVTVECCLDVPPTCNTCDMWAASRSVSMAPGSRTQQDLVVNCEAVP